MSGFSVKDTVPEKYQPYLAHWQQRKAEVRSRLQARHQAGLKQAKGLADILKSDFGATKVVLFGSMLSVNDIHMRSDIDLAVWDLPSKGYIEALTKLMWASDEFGVDLVRIEEAPPSLVAYIAEDGLVLGDDVPQSDPFISSQVSIPNHAVLIGRIRRELQDINTQYLQTRSQIEVARNTGQNAYWMAVSLGLHGIYTGFEKIFEQIARGVDGDLDKSSARWHKALLEQMTAGIPNVRVAVIDEQTFQKLTQYLSFRHVVRSNYAYRLEPEKIDENFQMLDDSYDSLVQQLEEFCNFLASAG
ncbi:MAG: nucleotidyltransferase domain-containing protein [Cyanobacteria bacterium P01_F01_bin.3]